MANNKIQIKRSVANATVTGLSNGELAFTQAGNVFFIGAPDGTSGSIRIGGLMVPGTLTANQALVANATSGIDKVITANLVANTIWANGAAGTAGDVLTSNGSMIYWKAPSAGVAGSDTQVQYNDAGNLAGAAGFTFTKASNNVTIANSLFVTTTANATTFTAGATGTGTGGLSANATVIFIGNNSINAAVNTTTLYIGGNVIANSTGANNAFNLGGTAASGYQTTAGLAANVATLTSNNATNLGGVAAASYVNTSGNYTQSGNLTLTGANLVVSGTNTSISSNVTLTGASITGTSTDATFRNGTFSGNLIVSGTVVTVNTQQLVVNDNIIELGLNNTTTDVVDTGFFSPAGNATNIWYSGIARIAASSTNTNPVFRVFVSNTNPNTASTIDTSANTRTGTIQAYLQPYGSGGALVANATAIDITANSTVSVSITANSLSLSSPLTGTNGGTGLATTTNNSLYFGNSTNGFNALALGTSGYVVQSNGTAIVYDTLDGGTF